jgi:putative methyltransferase (TIGR04325 family)
MTRLLTDLVPPIFWDFYQKVVRRVGFFGNYPDWETARQASSGYDADLIMNKVRNAMRKVRDGAAVYERDSVLFDEIHHSWPLLAALLWVASRKENRLNLLDFGGALGSTYYQNRKFLDHLGELKWSIVEQEKLVACGKHEFENGHVKFHSDIETCWREEHPDVVLFSSVLQYIDKPYDLLEKVVSLGFNFLLFDRTTFIDAGDDRITVQKVPSEIYGASYPAWFFNRDKFLGFLLRNYDLVTEFEALAGTIRLGKALASDRGFLFKRRT